MAGRLRIFRNPDVRGGLYPAGLAAQLGEDHFARAASAVRSWREYAPAPLRSLPGLADGLAWPGFPPLPPPPTVNRGPL